jgi:hypothetical protein
MAGLYRQNNLMTICLPKSTKELINACFSEKEQRRAILHRLEKELDSNYGSELVDRISFSIIRLMLENRDKDYEDVVFEMAAVDWRDLLVAAGHDQVDSHELWAEEILKQKPKVKLEKPIAKPVMPDSEGWIRCPNCKYKFKLSDPNAWDGKKHKRCLQPLRISS